MKRSIAGKRTMLFSTLVSIAALLSNAAAQQAAPSQAVPSEEEQQLQLAYQCYGITKVLSQTKSAKLDEAGLKKIAYKRFGPVQNFWLRVLQQRTGSSVSSIEGKVTELQEQVTKGIEYAPLMSAQQASTFAEQIEGMGTLCRNIQQKAEPARPRGPVLTREEKQVAQMCVVSARKQIEDIKADIAANSVMSQLTSKEILEQQITGYEAAASGFEAILKLQTPALNPPYRKAQEKLAREDQLTDESIEQAMVVAAMEAEESAAAKREGRPMDYTAIDAAREKSQQLMAELQTMKTAREAGCDALRVRLSGGPAAGAPQQTRAPAPSAALTVSAPPAETQQAPLAASANEAPTSNPTPLPAEEPASTPSASSTSVSAPASLSAEDLNARALQQATGQ